MKGKRAKPEDTRVVCGRQIDASPEREALLKATGAYLKSIGWTAAVANVDRIQEMHPLSTHFELVIHFTGGNNRLSLLDKMKLLDKESE